MKYVDFRKFTDEHGAQPIYLFEGEEVYFREKGEQLLKTRFVAEPTLDFASFDGTALKGDKISALIEAVNCFPFISEKRMIKVTEFYPTEKEYETYLKKLFDDPPVSSMLVIVNSGKGKAGTAALAKLKTVTAVDCGRSDEETIKKWIYLTMKKAGIYADGVTCSLLCAYCNYDMARVAKETEKLTVYCGAIKAERLTDEMVKENVYPESEYKIYELTDAISRKNYAEFIRIMQDFTQKNMDAVSLLSMIGSYFKTLQNVSAMRGSDAQVAAELGVKEFVVKKKSGRGGKV